MSRFRFSLKVKGGEYKVSSVDPESLTKCCEKVEQDVLRCFTDVFPLERTSANKNRERFGRVSLHLGETPAAVIRRVQHFSRRVSALSSSASTKSLNNAHSSSGPSSKARIPEPATLSASSTTPQCDGENVVAESSSNCEADVCVNVLGHDPLRQCQQPSANNFLPVSNDLVRADIRDSFPCGLSTTTNADSVLSAEQHVNTSSTGCIENKESSSGPCGSGASKGVRSTVPDDPSTNSPQTCIIDTPNSSVFTSSSLTSIPSASRHFPASPGAFSANSAETVSNSPTCTVDTCNKQIVAPGGVAGGTTKTAPRATGELLRQPRLQLNSRLLERLRHAKDLRYLGEQNPASPSASTGGQRSSSVRVNCLKVSDSNSGDAGGFVVCGPCGGRHFASTPDLCHKFGSWVCAQCVKFVLKMLKTSSSTVTPLKCLNTHACRVSIGGKSGASTDKRRCLACWLRSCLIALNLTSVRHNRLRLLLPRALQSTVPLYRNRKRVETGSFQPVATSILSVSNTVDTSGRVTTACSDPCVMMTSASAGVGVSSRSSSVAITTQPPLATVSRCVDSGGVRVSARLSGGRACQAPLQQPAAGATRSTVVHLKDGWKRRHVVRRNGRVDVVVCSPHGERFKSAVELQAYMRSSCMPGCARDYFTAAAETHQGSTRVDTGRSGTVEMNDRLRNIRSRRSANADKNNVRSFRRGKTRENKSTATSVPAARRMSAESASTASVNVSVCDKDNDAMMTACAGVGARTPALPAAVSVVAKRGPRVKSVCRSASVALGQPRATFADLRAAVASTNNSGGGAEEVARDKMLTKSNDARCTPDESGNYTAAKIAQPSRLRHLKRTNDSGDKAASDGRSLGSSIKTQLKLRVLNKYRQWTRAARVSLGAARSTRCGACLGCRAANCRQCVFCRDMVKYGGPGKLRKPCLQRLCWRPKLSDKLGTKRLSTARTTLTQSLKVNRGSSQTVMASSSCSAHHKHRHHPARRQCCLDAAETDSDGPRVVYGRVVRDCGGAMLVSSALPRGNYDSYGNTAVAGLSKCVGDACSDEQSSTVNVHIPLDSHDVWNHAVAVVLTTPLDAPLLCFLCGSGGSRDELVFCSACCEPFHVFCLDECEVPVTAVHEDTWLCRRCERCVVCGLPATPSSSSLHDDALLRCGRCNDTFHRHCVDPHVCVENASNTGHWVSVGESTRGAGSHAPLVATSSPPLSPACGARSYETLSSARDVIKVSSSRAVWTTMHSNTDSADSVTCAACDHYSCPAVTEQVQLKSCGGQPTHRELVSNSTPAQSSYSSDQLLGAHKQSHSTATAGNTVPAGFGAVHSLLLLCGDQTSALAGNDQTCTFDDVNLLSLCENQTVSCAENGERSVLCHSLASRDCLVSVPINYQVISQSEAFRILQASDDENTTELYGRLAEAGIVPASCDDAVLEQERRVLQYRLDTDDLSQHAVQSDSAPKTAAVASCQSAMNSGAGVHIDATRRIRRDSGPPVPFAQCCFGATDWPFWRSLLPRKIGRPRMYPRRLDVEMVRALQRAGVCVGQKMVNRQLVWSVVDQMAYVTVQDSSDYVSDCDHVERDIARQRRRLVFDRDGQATGEGVACNYRDPGSCDDRQSGFHVNSPVNDEGFDHDHTGQLDRENADDHHCDGISPLSAAVSSNVFTGPVSSTPRLARTSTSLTSFPSCDSTPIEVALKRPVGRPRKHLKPNLAGTLVTSDNEPASKKQQSSVRSSQVSADLYRRPYVTSRRSASDRVLKEAAGRVVLPGTYRVLLQGRRGAVNTASVRSDEHAENIGHSRVYDAVGKPSSRGAVALANHSATCSANTTGRKRGRPRKNILRNDTDQRPPGVMSSAVQAHDASNKLTLNASLTTASADDLVQANVVANGDNDSPHQIDLKMQVDSCNSGTSHISRVNSASLRENIEVELQDIEFSNSRPGSSADLHDVKAPNSDIISSSWSFDENSITASSPNYSCAIHQELSTTCTKYCGFVGFSLSELNGSGNQLLIRSAFSHNGNNELTRRCSSVSSPRNPVSVSDCNLSTAMEGEASSNGCSDQPVNVGFIDGSARSVLDTGDSSYDSLVRNDICAEDSFLLDHLVAVKSDSSSST